MKIIFSILFVLLVSCFSELKKESAQSENKTDTTEIICKFIYGLWSLDTGDAFSNVGFYFRPEGTVDFVPAEASGTWEFTLPDSLKINYQTITSEQNFNSKLHYLDESRMILIEKTDTFSYRKVPFGINNDGMLLQGFGGQLAPGEEKKYNVNLPATKKISFKLISESPEITLRVYEGNNELTSAPLREWNAIIIRSGNYSVVVSRQPTSVPVTPQEFDLKVIGY